MSSGPGDPGGVDTALGILGALAASMKAKARKVKAAVDIRTPGVVLVAKSGRRYQVQADGSWRRLR